MKALQETRGFMPGIVLCLLLVYLPAGQTARADAPPGEWWDSSFLYRQKITITAGSVNTPTQYAVRSELDHATLVSASKSLASGNDLRIAFWNGSGWEELDRRLDDDSSWNDATTQVWFQTSAQIDAGLSDGNYYVYYGNTSAGAPPTLWSNIFLFYDDFSGASVDPARWSVVSTPASQSGGLLTLGAGGKVFATAPYALGTDTRWEGKLRLGGDGSEANFNYLTGSNDTVFGDDYAAFWSTSTDHLIENQNAWTTAGETFSNPTATSDRVYTFDREGMSGVRYFVDGSELGFVTEQVPDADLRMFFWNDTGVADGQIYDWVRVRHYVTSEPTNLLGTEEMENGPNTISGMVFEDADFAGTATDYDGGTNDAPLADVDMELYSGTDIYITSTATAGDGSFSFSGLADGTYKIRARSATIGDLDTPPAGGLNATVPATWPYPLPEMTWGNGAPLIGGQDPTVDDMEMGDNAGPGDTFISVTVNGDVADIELGFAFNLIVNTLDDGLADNTRSDQGSLRQFLKNANAIGTAGGTTANYSRFRIPSAGPHTVWTVGALPVLVETATLDGDDGVGGRAILDGTTAGNVSGLSLTGSDITVTNIVVQNFLGTSSNGIRIHDGTDRNTVSNCMVQEIGVDGIRVDWLGADTDLDHEITDCTVSGSGHDGIVLVNVDGISVTNCIIENSTRNGINIVGANNGSGSNLIAGNIIRGHGSRGVSIWDNGCSGNIFHTNIIHSNFYDGLRIGSGGNDTRIYHNTFDNNGTSGNGSGVIVSSGVTGVIARNNLFTNNNRYGLTDGDGGASTSVDYCGFYGNGTAACNYDCMTGSQNIISDPQYAPPGPPANFSLTECASPAIDAGADLGVDQPDLNGSDPGNYNGPAPDMGAIETSCEAAAVYEISGLVFEDTEFVGSASGYDGGTSDVPLANVDVELYSGTDIYITSAATAGDGSYSFSGLSDGTYKIRVRTATIGDADTPPAGGLHPTVPATWPYPLAEMTWGHNAALIGGQDHTVDDTATGDNVGPGDTYVTVTVSGADVTGVNFGFCYELIVNVDDDANADSIRSKQGTLRQFIKNSNAIVGVNKSWFQIP